MLMRVSPEGAVRGPPLVSACSLEAGREGLLETGACISTLELTSVFENARLVTCVLGFKLWSL